MKRSAVLALGAFLLFPYLVSVDGDSSGTGSTFLELAIGKGLYAGVDRDCAGNVIGVNKHSFYDAGVKIVHESSALKVSAGAGVTSGDGADERSGNELSINEGMETETTSGKLIPYFTSTVGLDTKYFGVDAGPLVLGTGKKPVVHLAGNIRLGSEDDIYVSFASGHNTCLLAGNSLLEIGTGINLGKPHSLLWAGWGVIPYDYKNGILSLKVDIPITGRFILQPRAGIGLGGFGEYSLAIGGRVYF